MSRPAPPIARVPEVFAAFLRLGLTAFGGPVAHLGYYHAEFVERRRWISADDFAELLAVCQFLPGPGSTQVAFSIAMQRAGLLGGIAGFLGFALPAATVMIAAAAGLARFDLAAHGGVIDGLKLAAAGVVAWALIGMARRLTPDGPRLTIAVAALGLVLAVPGIAGQLAALALGAAVAPLGIKATALPAGGGLVAPVGRRGGAVALGAFAALLALALVAPTSGHTPAVLAAMVRAGSLVFGGGHVVLPLLHAPTVPAGLLEGDTFLAGYGLAQALPGPLFTFGGYVGTAVAGPLVGAVAVLAIFLPGLLLVLGVLPFWQVLRRVERVRRHLAGVNAAVVGVLAGACYDPVLTSAVHGWPDLLVAAAVLAGLASGRAPPWALVLACGAVGYAFY